jgi:hypothetical protein
MLFNIFYSTKYFHAYLSTIACYFYVGCFTYLNAMKILW